MEDRQKAEAAARETLIEEAREWRLRRLCKTEDLVKKAIAEDPPYITWVHKELAAFAEFILSKRSAQEPVAYMSKDGRFMSAAQMEYWKLSAREGSIVAPAAIDHFGGRPLYASPVPSARPQDKAAEVMMLLEKYKIKDEQSGWGRHLTISADTFRLVLTVHFNKKGN